MISKIDPMAGLEEEVEDGLEKFCIRNGSMRYWFENDGRPRITRHEFRQINGLPKDAKIVKKFCDHCDKASLLANGSPIILPRGMDSFRQWMHLEFTNEGVPYIISEETGKWLMPDPDEIWAIYRIRMMARYNVSKLPPCFDIDFGNHDGITA
jgi:hypothetical protein